MSDTLKPSFLMLSLISPVDSSIALSIRINPCDVLMM